jgi:LmbE family N-acetylglucosaminyl deacetylase
MSKGTLVAIHAHPDDAEIFVAGTMALMQQQGYELVIATMTAGGLGGMRTGEEETARLRRAEAKAAAAQLDARYHCCSGSDGYLFDSEKLRAEVTGLLRRERASIVFTHPPDDYHVDHRATCQIVEAAVMASTLPNAHCPEAPLTTTPLLYHCVPLGAVGRIDGEPVHPQFYVDVSPVFERKMAMLREHRSQVELMHVSQGMNDFFEAMTRQSAELGARAGCTYAEAFWQHRGAGFDRRPVVQETIAAHVRSPGATG